MSRTTTTQFLAGALALFVLAGSACSAKKLPGLRKPRNPGNQEQSQPEVGNSGAGSEEVSEPKPPAEPGGNTGSGNTEQPEPPAPSTPGEVVTLIGAAADTADYAFVPQPQASLAAASADAPPAGPGKHPRLYFSASELSQLQTRAKADESGIAERIFAYGDRAARSRNQLPPASMAELPKANGTWRKYGDRLMGVATAYALQTDQKKKSNYADWAVEAMRRIADWKAWGPSHEYAVGLDGAHILFGFSVAYDLVYDRLNQRERELFAERIKTQAELFFEETQKRDPEFWTTSYTNNHNYTNHNALLNAALAVEDVYPREAKQWIQQCVRNTALVMELRALVTDGSTNEGVMYGTYGSHTLFATLDLLHEHRLADHFDNPWLTQHFNFLLHGSMPGFRRVVSIADGHGSYGHGPRHLLYFLDYVTRDGRPTWAAQRVEEALGSTQPYGKPEGSNLLFEFLWHDPKLEPIPVNLGTTSGLHRFDDWGVVTFRRGWSAKDTFLSFKAGDPAGEAMWDLMLKGDKRVSSTNVSHSHPDAGGFTFLPGGQDFISGALYAKPKRTALSNTYTFTPDFAMAPPVPQSAISRMWDPKKASQIGRLDEIGQLGEWQQWMGPIKGLIKAQPNADLVASVKQGDAVFMSGEFGDTYPKQVAKRGGNGNGPLGVDRVYRSLLLLPEDVLVVVDRVESSKRVAAHAYFRALSEPSHQASWKTQGMTATLQGGGAPGSEVQIYHPKNAKIETGLELFSYEDATGDNRGGIRDWGTVPHASAYARFTNPNQSGAETYVYVLRPSGVQGDIIDMQLVQDAGVRLVVETKTRTYDVRIATEHDRAIREKLLGYDGYVKVDYAAK